MLKSAFFFVVLLFTFFFVPQFAQAQSGPTCDARYHWVEVPGTKSLDGTETGFQYICLNGSPSGPLLIFLDGGGGCWSGDTCDCRPDSYGNCQGPNSTINDNHFGLAESFDGQQWGQEQTPNQSIDLFGQTAAFAGPTSPFTGGSGVPFNFVIIPYSTGDAFMGDKVQNYTTSDGRTITAHHVGYSNVTYDLLRIKQLFPSPTKVVVWGDSAGGDGADCNLIKFRLAWLFTRMWEMSNAGPPAEANLMPLVPEVARTWGVWQPGPGESIIENTCPIYPGPGSTHWTIEWIKRFNARVLPNVRKAFTDDYSDAAVSFFACLWGATVDPNGSCTSAVASALNEEFTDVISTSPNYKVYYHTGICHTEREADGNTVAGGSDPSCDFDGMQQNGIYFRDWVHAWINDSPSWSNVR